MTILQINVTLLLIFSVLYCRADFRKDTGNGSDSMMLLGTDVDTFLSCDQVADDLSMSDEGNLPQVRLTVFVLLMS